MSLCNICGWTPEHCRARTVRIVTDAELDSDAFRFDVRVFLSSLRVPSSRMLDFLTDCYRDSDCAIVVDEKGSQIEFEFDVLEFPNFRYWLRGLRQLPPPWASTRLKAEKRETFRVLATLLKIVFPAESQLWGVRAANDNEPSYANDDGTNDVMDNRLPWESDADDLFDEDDF